MIGYQGYTLLLPNRFANGQRAPWRILALLLPSLLSGCLSGNRRATPLPASQALGREFSTPLPPAVAVTHDNPSGPITLRDAIGLVLQQSPALSSYAWARRAAEADFRQAGALPNPVLSVLAEDVGATSALQDRLALNDLIRSQTTIQLGQLVELGGERSARKRTAGFERDRAGWDYELARLNTLTSATQAFLEVLLAQELAALADSATRIAEAGEASARARVAAGEASPIEETRAAVAHATAEIEQARAHRALESRRNRLAAAWGSPTAQFSEAVGQLASATEPPPLSALLDRLEQTPGFVRWETIVAERASRLDLERARRVPDLSVIAGLRRFADLPGQTYLFGASLTFPLFNRNGGAIAAAEARITQASEDAHASRIAGRLVLGEGHRALGQAHEEWVTLHERVLPGAEAAFAAVSEGYQLGKFSYLDVLDVQRTLVAAKVQELRARAEYQMAVAELEGLLGIPLTQLSNPTQPARPE